MDAETQLRKIRREGGTHAGRSKHDTALWASVHRDRLSKHASPHAVGNLTACRARISPKAYNDLMRWMDKH